MMRPEDKIRLFAQERNILIGICSAERLDYLEGVSAVENTPFVNKGIEYRINPTLSMTEARSVIVVGVPYESRDEGKGSEKFAVGVLGTDYHVRVKQVLSELAECLKAQAMCGYKILVDSHPLVERELAKKAGIGWQGKNCMLISEKFGSYFNIGIMLTSLSLEPNKGFSPRYTLCGNCNACITACIGKCLKPYNLDYTKCVSYITQKKEPLTEQEYKSLHGYVYGCDVCQLVCKFNKGRQAGRRFANLETLTKSDLGSAAWRGKRTLLRNAKYNYSEIVK